ncbi:putative fungal specific transcription [Diaporthe ampelina]|uniref:Putative fungal specific transcription n=1 Tax=Diaporthe ampelina TaxID=1214573 RepID=A0A0G2FA83_9PEZI|nr:putative fungal specific transcription [Diaporthe ampelina]
MRSATDSHLYAACKRFLAQLESAGTVSILFLQAMVLVALYEFGHSVYPAAWMTSGSCVRYAAMLGLPSYQGSSTILGHCTTWTEAEERRRVWWATYVLDRFISLGSKNHFAGDLDQPVDSERLPIDDRAWDSGDMALSIQRSTITPLEDLTASHFARLAQASMLTSRAMAHCKGASRRYVHRGDKDSGNGPTEGKEKHSIREATEIIRDLHTLSHAIETDIANAGGVGSDAYFALSPSRCLVWSTMIMVMDLYSCPEHMHTGAGVGSEDGRTAQELAMQVEAIKGLMTTSERIKVFAGELLSLSHTPATSPDVSMAGADSGGEVDAVERLSPLCFDAIYCALATFHWQWKENGQPEMKRGVEQTRAALVRMARRWRLAGEYLEIERHHEVIGIVTDRADWS